MQSRVTQSRGSTHERSTGQAGQLSPPQSVSVSLPFKIASSHAGAAHTPDPQELLRQSAPLPHFSPRLHDGQAPPPQSASLSRPLTTPSAQFGA